MSISRGLCAVAVTMLLCAGGLVYFQNEAGRTIVVRPGNMLKIVASNDIGSKKGEIFRASPVPTRGQIITRSDRAVYCIGEK